MGLLLNIYLGTLTQRKQEENEKFRISIATKVTNLEHHHFKSFICNLSRFLEEWLTLTETKDMPWS